MQMEEIIAELRQQRDRIDAALFALTGETANTKPAPAKPKRAKRKEASKEGRVRPETLESILGAFNGDGEPLSREQIRARTGLSPDTVRRGLDAARSADLIRRAGVADDSRAHRYALMPSGGQG